MKMVNHPARRLRLGVDVCTLIRQRVISEQEKSRSVKSGLTVSALGFLVFGLASRPALAATPTTSFSVTATVQATCLASAASMRFGTHNGTAVSATSTVSVTCTDSTPYNVALSAGLASGATAASPEMKGPGSALLGYSLSTNPQGRVDWGQTLGRNAVGGTGNGSTKVLAVHGGILGGQSNAAGGYPDTITVTVTY